MLYFLDLWTVKHAFWPVFMRNPKISRKYLIYSHKHPEKWSLSPRLYLCFSSDSSCESSPDTPASVHQCLNSGHPETNHLSSCLGWESAEDESDFERWQLAWLCALMCHLHQLMLDVYGLAFLMCLSLKLEHFLFVHGLWVNGLRVDERILRYCVKLWQILINNFWVYLDLWPPMKEKILKFLSLK